MEMVLPIFRYHTVLHSEIRNRIFQNDELVGLNDNFSIHKTFCSDFLLETKLHTHQIGRTSARTSQAKPLRVGFVT